MTDTPKNVVFSVAAARYELLASTGLFISRIDDYMFDVFDVLV